MLPEADVADRVTSEKQRLRREESEHVSSCRRLTPGASGVKAGCGGERTEKDSEGNQIRKGGILEANM